MNMTKEELEAELRRIKQEEAEQARLLREATPIRMKFTLEPSVDKHYEVYDESCALYKLTGEVTNEEEAIAAGHQKTFLSGGAVTYVYSKLSRKLIMHVGGGTIYVSKGWGSKSDVDHNRPSSAEIAMAELSEFVSLNPQGGDVTEIVQRHRRRTGLV